MMKKNIKMNNKDVLSNNEKDLLCYLNNYDWMRIKDIDLNVNKKIIVNKLLKRDLVEVKKMYCRIEGHYLGHIRRKNIYNVKYKIDKPVLIKNSNKEEKVYEK